MTNQRYIDQDDLLTNQGCFNKRVVGQETMGKSEGILANERFVRQGGAVD